MPIFKRYKEVEAVQDNILQGPGQILDLSRNDSVIEANERGKLFALAERDICQIEPAKAGVRRRYAAVVLPEDALQQTVPDGGHTWTKFLELHNKCVPVVDYDSPVVTHNTDLIKDNSDWHHRFKVKGGALGISAEGRLSANTKVDVIDLEMQRLALLSVRAQQSGLYPIVGPLIDYDDESSVEEQERQLAIALGIFQEQLESVGAISDLLALRASLISGTDNLDRDISPRQSACRTERVIRQQLPEQTKVVMLSGSNLADDFRTTASRDLAGLWHEEAKPRAIGFFEYSDQILKSALSSA